MNKKYKGVLWLIGILILILLGLFIYSFFFKKEEKDKINIDIVDEIKDYGYSINNLDSKYYKKLFIELKDTLDNEEVDKDKYATLVAQLFITDLYSIETKVNKYDVGGDIYFHEDKRDLHKTKVVETFYNLVKDNTYGDRKQELPLVKETMVDSITKGTYNLGSESVNSYIVKLSISYEKDLGYDKEATVILVDNGKKIEVVQLGEIETNEEES